MELQERNRLYPNISPAPSNLVMGSDGRLQYAPINQSFSSAPIHSNPSAPSYPVLSAPSYPVISAPSQNNDATEAQRSLNCWGKTVRIASAIILALNVVSFLMFAIKLAYPPEDAPKGHCKFMLIGRIALFLILCVVSKLGLRAGKFKTSVAAKKFLVGLIIFGIVIALFAGFAAFKKANVHNGGNHSGGNHSGGNHDSIDDHQDNRPPNDNPDSRPPNDNAPSNHHNADSKLFDNEILAEDPVIINDETHAEEQENIDTQEDLNTEDDLETEEDSDTEDDSDASGHGRDHKGKDHKGKDHHGGKNHHEGKDHKGKDHKDHEGKNHHEGKDHKDHEGKNHHEGKDHEGKDHKGKNHKGKHHGEDDEDSSGGNGRHHQGKGRHDKGKRCAIIGGSIAFAVYSGLVVIAYMLLRSARRFEELAQRGNVPMMPNLAQQPVLAYVPGHYPANIPMGAPVQQ